MGNVFISYRRDQTSGEARALHNDLAERLGADRVFMDVDDIPPGRDFREVLRDRLDDAQTVLALIGRDWADAKDAAGNRRLEQADDFVRFEIATALQRKLQVVPLLLQGAQFPPAEKLPADLRELGFRNGFTISHATWESNVDELVRRLGLGGPPRPAAPTAAAPSHRRLWVGAGLGLVLAAGIGTALALHDAEPAPAELARLFADLGGPDGAAQQAAAQRLNRELRGSPSAASYAVSQLNPERWFPMKTFKGRTELVQFLIDADDSAYTPAVKAQADQAVRRLRQSLEAGRVRITPEMVKLLDRLEQRLAR